MNNNKLLIIGAGGHGGVVADTALISHSFEEIAFLDDVPDQISKTAIKMNLPIIGKIQTAFTPALLDDWKSIFVAIGRADLRLQLISKLLMYGYELPNIIHPRAVLSKHSEIGYANAVFANAVIQANAVLGNGIIVNTSSGIDHDSFLDDGVHICPGAFLAGGVSVGARSWVGIGSSIRDHVKVGKDVIVGAGASVVSDIPNNTIVMGVPAKPYPNVKFRQV